MGPLPLPLFSELHKGLVEREHLERAINAEVDWLNQESQFDFEYEPFEEDRLMFFAGGEKIAFSFQKGMWKHLPHQAYSVDSRIEIDADAEDKKARAKAAEHLRTRYGNGG